MKKCILAVLVIGNLFLVSCGNKPKSEQKEKSEKVTVKKSAEKQLNITFLLDLSDRIEPSKYPANPEHWERDIAIIKEFVQIFKAEMEHKGGYNAKGKMKVLFRPAPQDPNINQLAENLEVDLEPMKAPQKKQIYDNLEQSFTESLKKIYEKTLETKQYIGSDIWRFFKDDVTDLAIDIDPNYRNILVVITDGYLYHKNTKMQEGHRYSYILPNQIRSLGLTNSKWKERMDKSDFGLIVPRTDLKNLEVLMLEVNPSKKSSPYETDVISAVLEKWFKEMGIQKFGVYKTSIPQTTKKRIENFMGK